jgi:hypothetical protein
MKALREVAGQDLQWTGKDEFELRVGDEVLAIVHAGEKRADWTIGETADGRWVLKSRNLAPGDLLVITEPETMAEVAVVKHGQQHGIFRRVDDYLELGDEGRWTWKKASAWFDEWDWVDHNAEPLIHFQRGHHMVIEPLAGSLPALSLLVLAGWQLIRLQEEARKKAAAVAVATTAASSVVVNH